MAVNYHPIVREQSPKNTTPMDTNHDHSVEIYEKSPDISLVIPYDENLEMPNEQSSLSLFFPLDEIQKITIPIIRAATIPSLS